MINVQARISKVIVSSKVDRNAPLVRGDGRRIQQILSNLLSNAVKFTEAGGHVGLSIARKGDRLEFVVRDNGIGIAAENIHKALASFGQVQSHVSRKHQGTGLGLPLAKQLTEMHGGTLTLESELDVGTVVTVTLPPERMVWRQ